MEGPFSDPGRGGGDGIAAASGRGNAAVMVFTGEFLIKIGNEFIR